MNITDKEIVDISTGKSDKKVLDKICAYIENFVLSDVFAGTIISHQYSINMCPLIDMICGLPIPISEILAVVHHKWPYVIFSKCYLDSGRYNSNCASGCINTYNKLSTNIIRPISPYDNSRILHLKWSNFASNNTPIDFDC